MRPLNYAMLKYFTTVDEASVDDVMDALKGDYSDFTPIKRDKLQEALRTAEKNGLIGESRVDLDKNGDLRVFYSATPEQRDTINSYIK